MEKIPDNFWEVTYRQNIAMMEGVCYRYTQNRQTAEDLAHDAFLIAIRKFSSFANKGPFEAWLRRITVNVALQYLREQKKQRKFVASATNATNFDNLQQENSLETTLAFSENELLEVINSLPEHHRMVFNLYVIDHFTHAQIAAQLGISEGTSKSHLARARKKARELLFAQFRKTKKGKRVMPFWLLHRKLWNVDRTVERLLNDLPVQPLKNLPTEYVSQHPIPVEARSLQGISHTIYLKAGFIAVGTLFLLGGAPNFDTRSTNVNEKTEKAMVSRKAPKHTYNVTSKSKKDNFNLFSHSATATLTNHSVIVKNTKKTEPMKNLKTLSTLLMAGLTFDFLALPAVKPLPFTTNRIAESRISEQKKAENDTSGTRRNDKPLKGTFYAEKIFWSEKNNELYLLGSHVKVDLNTQKFTGSGKFSFINRFSYLVIDGVQVKPNDTIKLTAKKYNFLELQESEGIKKYGDKGKSGVVEITLAE
ncbi:hypothetical protein DYBT9275_02255 [Dyadobacter sp. CECT 9275]|uniref:Sigma-70 family RNA polymerase sigma factor n=1 Tax=Dyadobacter helix TaxID=2822344 RepID=A0A916NBQ9_9BACT|nr:RNA polymerase sigma factor [Dyadobacter sp. CECT 9275]CAG4999570.1 hypothetical protein DYBT9275_02255 [Dyadobacter sp. CECT 9275]